VGGKGKVAGAMRGIREESTSSKPCNSLWLDQGDRKETPKDRGRLLMEGGGTYQL